MIVGVGRLSRINLTLTSVSGTCYDGIHRKVSHTLKYLHIIVIKPSIAALSRTQFLLHRCK